MKKAMKIFFFLILLSGGFIAFYYYLNNKFSKKLIENEASVYKFKKYYKLVCQWLQLKNKGRTIEEYFKKHGYNTIAIYGFGELGNRLYEELQNSTVSVAYAIDKKANIKYSSLKVIDVDDKFDPVDVIVITPIFDYDAIKTSLSEKTDIKLVSLDEVISKCV